VTGRVSFSQSWYGLVRKAENSRERWCLWCLSVPVTGWGLSLRARQRHVYNLGFGAIVIETDREGQLEMRVRGRDRGWETELRLSESCRFWVEFLSGLLTVVLPLFWVCVSAICRSFRQVCVYYCEFVIDFCTALCFTIVQFRVFKVIVSSFILHLHVACYKCWLYYIIINQWCQVLK